MGLRDLVQALPQNTEPSAGSVAGQSFLTRLLLSLARTGPQAGTSQATLERVSPPFGQARLAQEGLESNRLAARVGGTAGQLAAEFPAFMLAGATTGQALGKGLRALVRGRKAARVATTAGQVGGTLGGAEALAGEQPTLKSIAAQTVAGAIAGPVIGEAARPLIRQVQAKGLKSLIGKVGGGKLGKRAAEVAERAIPDVQLTPVQRVTRALKQAKPLERKQATIFHEIRSRQSGAIQAIGKEIPGEAGFRAQLSQLKGQLPKVQFETLRKKVTQSDIDALFTQIEATESLAPFQRINAKAGLAKLFGAEGGAVPTKSEMRLLADVFPPEFLSTVLEKRPFTQILFDKATDALNLPKAVKASTDFSAPLRQGVFFIGRPGQFLPAFTKMFRQFFSERAYQGLQKDIASRPTFKLMQEHNLALTDILVGPEEAFLSQMAERLPVYGPIIRASNRAYTGFLNKLRADVFDDLVGKASQRGLVEGNPELISQIANFINNATGRGALPAGLEGSAALLNGALFSPRLLASRLNLLNPLFYINQQSFVRREALKSLLSMAGTGMSVLGLAHLGGAEVKVDPRNTDFGKMKLGNTRYDIWGGFQQYLVAASKMWTGESISSTTGRETVLGEGFKPTTRLDIGTRFLTGKLAPVPAFVVNLLRGKTFIGQDVQIPVEVANLFVPMVLDDLFDLSQERGAQGVFMSIPAFFGVGLQNYGDVIPIASETPSGKLTIKFRQPPGLAESVLNRITGTQVSTVPPEFRPGLVQERFQKLQRTVEINKTKRLVLEDGQSRQVGETIVFLQGGVVKTKRLARIPSLKGRVERQMGNVRFTPTTQAKGLRALVTQP